MTSRSLSQWLVKARWPLLGLACVLAAISWKPAGGIRFDRSVENMFRPGDPLVRAHQRLKREFGGHDVVMATYLDPRLLAESGEGIERLEHVERRLNAIPGVREVLTLADVNQALNHLNPLRNLMGGEEDPRPVVRRDSELGAAYREMFEGYTHDAEGKIASLVCMLKPQAEATSTAVPASQTSDHAETIDRIREIIERQPGGMIAGEPVMVADGFRYLEKDGQRLGWLTRILLGLTIVICFASFRWVLIPLAIVQLALVLTRATLFWLNLRLSMVSSMLTAIVTVIGIATVIHVVIRFRHARALGMPQRAALVATGTALAVPIFWACSTDAVGFLSLTIAKVGPVQDFGIMTSIGSLWVLVSTALLVPALALWGRFDADPHQVWGDSRLGGGLTRLVHSAQHHKRRLILLLIVLLTASATGLTQLKVETDFTRNFRHGSPIVRSYSFIEKNLGGAGVWDILVPAPSRLNTRYVQRVYELEQDLRGISIRDNNSGKEIGLTKVLSLVDGIEAAGVNPLLKHVPPEIKARGMELAMPHFIASLRTRKEEPGSQDYLRIMLRSREQLPAAAKSQLIDTVRSVAHEHFPGGGDEPAATVTGPYVLLTNLITSILRDQWVCFAAAALGVGFMMTLAFRGIPLALIAMVPNVLPILMVLGGMGWLGVRVNMGAAMIAAVSMGLSVDSSIHYITAFRRARDAGCGLTESLETVQQTVGRAVVYSTIALIVGFLALCTSQFVPTIYFGCLVSLAMLGGLFGNLVLLPLLLAMASKKRTLGLGPKNSAASVGSH
ncbi:MAG: efflux RND transporter permease subunit [Planctomycetota bacterium]